MSDFVTDPDTLSQSSLMQQQFAFLNSIPDNIAWKDKYRHSTGTTEIRLNSGVGTTFLRSVIANRREVYLREAKLLSSVIGIANNLGYSCRRPSNKTIRIKFTPSTTRNFSKFDVVGTCKGFDLVVANTTNVIKNVITTIDIIVGNLKTATITAPDDSLNIFRFLDQNVSNDIQLFFNKNNVTIPIEFSNRVIDLENDKFVVITNPYFSIDIFYLNNTLGRYFYETGDSFTLNYIEASDFDFEINTNQILFNYGTIFSSVISPTTSDSQFLTSYIPFEDINSIKINAPLLFETQMKIRGRNDFKKVFLLLGAGQLIDTNAKDISPAVVGLTYLKSDKTSLTLTEKTAYRNYLNEQASNYGVLFKDIYDSVESAYQLTIKIKTYLNVDINNLDKQVREILNYVHKDYLNPVDDNRIGNRSLKLQHTLNLDQIEREINNIRNINTNLAPIQINRVTLKTSIRIGNTNYSRGNFVTLDGNINNMYECVKSGQSENLLQDFSTNPDDLIYEGIDLWSNKFYTAGDYIRSNEFYPVIFKAINSGTSGVVAPTWGQVINNQTVDNGVIWLTVDPLLEGAGLIWRCRDINIRQIETYWNNFITLDYGAFEWQV